MAKTLPPSASSTPPLTSWRAKLLTDMHMHVVGVSERGEWRVEGEDNRLETEVWRLKTEEKQRCRRAQQQSQFACVICGTLRLRAAAALSAIFVALLTVPEMMMMLPHCAACQVATSAAKAAATFSMSFVCIKQFATIKCSVGRRWAWPICNWALATWTVPAPPARCPLATPPGNCA